MPPSVVDPMADELADAAYDAVASSRDAAARPGSRLSCREVYLVEPATIGEDDLICDIAFPLG